MAFAAEGSYDILTFVLNADRKQDIKNYVNDLEEPAGQMFRKNVLMFVHT